MHVAALRVDLHIPESHSLKEKRAVVRPIVEGARRRYAVAAAEVGHLDQWQRSVVAMSVVSSTQSHAAEVLDAVERFVWSHPEIEVLAADRSWLEVDHAG